MIELRRYIRSIILNEGIKPMSEFYGKGLIISKRYRSNVYLLFDLKLKEFLRRSIKRDRMTFENPKSAAIRAVRENLIVGMIVSEPRTRGHLGASEINYAAAEQGWGPTMYDIAMSLEPNGIIGSRESVSEESQDVWDYYKRNRNDIQKLPLDWKYGKWTDSEEDDAYLGNDGDYFGSDEPSSHGEMLNDPLSWVYRRGEYPGVDILLESGKELFEDIGVKWSQEEKNDFVYGCAMFYFQDRFK